MYEMSQAVAGSQPAMDAVYAWGIAFIHAIQAAECPALTLAARFFTLLGNPVIYLAVLPAMLWCIDERRGFALGLTVFLSNGVNVALKETLRVPRPCALDPSVQLAPAPDPYSTPSGHSQNSAAFWPILLLGRKKDAAWRLAFALALPFCIGLSRIYLGVHYPTDVAFGWALGALFSVTTLVLIPAFSRKFNSRTDGFPARARKLFDSYHPGEGRSFRTIKLALAALAAYILNAASRGNSSMGGLVFGFAAGYILLTERAKDGTNPNGGFSAASGFQAASGSLAQKALRLALGLAVLVAIYFGLKRIFPGAESPYYSLCRFIRYGITGFWASWGAPRVFLKLGLARQSS